MQTGQDGQYVFVVKDDSDRRAAARSSPGSASSDDTVVQKGLKPGETVVTEGQLRLEPGSHVTTDLRAAPAPAGGRGGRGGGAAAGQGARPEAQQALAERSSVPSVNLSESSSAGRSPPAC